MEEKITNEWLEKCSLCPRNCNADRRKGGACGTYIRTEDGKIMLPVARAALHFWEEPCISGERGSGAVFFSGCNLGCIFCQNREISSGMSGKYIDVGRLTDIFLELQEQGANNINLVTAGHVLPPVREALIAAKQAGLKIPILYNTSSYEKVETLKALDGLVDIYLPDYKYSSGIFAKSFSFAPNYPEVAAAAIDEMFRQTGPVVLDEEGLIKSGLVIRHLVLPGCTQDSKKVIRYLHEKYGNAVILSIMNQYTPPKNSLHYPVLNRKLKKSEYDSVVEFALSIGVENAYIQSSESASESFIPAFDHTGV